MNRPGAGRPLVPSAVGDPRQRFNAGADRYARYRPTYPAAAVDWIIATAGLAPGAAVVDLGCGTGIASRLFAARGFDVVGIDPSDDMLGQARRAGGGPRYQRGEAEATGLAGGSVDLAVSAQAFHWFDVPRTLVELRRVLRPPRWIAALWNVSGGGGLMEDYEKLLGDHSPAYRATCGDRRLDLHGMAGVADARLAEAMHEERLDWETFVGRIHTSSFVVHDLADPESFEAGLRSLFERHTTEGTVGWRYLTEIIAFRVAP